MRFDVVRGTICEDGGELLFIAFVHRTTTVVAMAAGVVRAMALCCCCYSNAVEMAAAMAASVTTTANDYSTNDNRPSKALWQRSRWPRQRYRHDFDSTGTMLCAASDGTKWKQHHSVTHGTA